MTKNAYWRKREAEQLKHYISEDTKIQKIMSEKYDYMLRQIELQINDFYARYARAEKITLAEAQQRVAKMDVQAFSSKAKKYVKEKNFSPQANKELRLYNATMRINRLELLKANIGLEMIDGFNEIEQTLNEGLTKRTSDELKRQEQILRQDAGILAETIFDNAKTVQSIVNASFQNATWSTRIWGNQAQLRDSLSALLTNGLIQGRNPLQLSTALRDLFGASRKAAERLMVTEMARVQTGAQMESFKRNDIDQYEFISVDTACPTCMELDGEHFRVADMAPGENAPPIHPHCRCSTAAYVDREALGKELGIDLSEPENVENNGETGYNKYKELSLKEFKNMTHQVSKEERELIYGHDRDTGYINSSNARKYINAPIHEGKTLEPYYQKIADTLNKVISRNTIDRNIKVTRYVNDDALEGMFGIKVPRPSLKDTPEEAYAKRSAALKARKTDTYTEKAFLSTSGAADKNVMQDKTVVMNINVNKGTHGFVTSNYQESEIIFGSGTKIKLLSAYVDRSVTPWKTVLDCEIVI